MAGSKVKPGLRQGSRGPAGTCVPSGPIRSRAPAALDRKRTIFRKLSSPMLQEPSTRKTRSARAVLQPGQEEDVKLLSTHHSSSPPASPGSRDIPVSPEQTPGFQVVFGQDPECVETRPHGDNRKLRKPPDRLQIPQTSFSCDSGANRKWQDHRLWGRGWWAPAWCWGVWWAAVLAQDLEDNQRRAGQGTTGPTPDLLAGGGG